MENNNVYVPREVIHGNNRRSIVMTLVHSGGCEHLNSLGYLSKSQIISARKVDEIFDAAHVTHLPAMDTSKIRVDGATGGGGPDERRLIAQKQLASIKASVGLLNYQVLNAVIGQGRGLCLPPVPANDNPLSIVPAGVAVLRRALDALDVVLHGAPKVKRKRRKV